MPPKISSNEIDGRAATKRFLRHLARHTFETGANSQQFDNTTFTACDASDRRSIGIIELTVPRNSALVDGEGSDEPLEYTLLSHTGDEKEVRKSVPQLESTPQQKGRVFLPLRTSAKDADDGRMTVLALAASFPHEEEENAHAVAERFIEEHGHAVVMFLRKVAEFKPIADLPIEPPRYITSTTVPRPADTHAIDEKITALFESDILKRRITAQVEADYWDKGGRDEFKRLVHGFTCTGRRILFLLPAFPWKSTNLRKVLGDMPDYGEYLALQRMDNFLEEISKVYAKGATLVLFSDGTVYNDVYGVSDETTAKFRTAIRNTHPSKHIIWSDLDEFFEGLSQAGKRVALEGLFGASADSVTARIKEDPDFCYTFCGFRKFLEQDLEVEGTGKKGAGKRTILKTKARGLITRNYAYGRMMRVNFREHIRLTIHPSANGGCPGVMTKFSVNLIGASDWGTPWHNCALKQKDGTWTLIRRHDAEAKGLTLELSSAESGRLPYFTEIPRSAEEEREEISKHDKTVRMAQGIDGRDEVVGGDGTGVVIDEDEYDPKMYGFETQRDETVPRTRIAVALR